MIARIEVSTIKAVLESLKVEGVHNEALMDCLAYANLPVSTLEGFLDSHLWFAEDADFDVAYPTDEAKAYTISLCHIEQVLVSKGLIYNS